MAEQNFENHVRFFPPFHFFVVPVLLINFGWSIHRATVAGFSADGIISIVVALALLLGFLTARLMALSVQNRVIRLEEQLRYERLLPADLKSRAGDLTLGQIVSLRFASDAELPGLVRKVLDEKLDNRKAIKQLIKNWRPDYLRA
jgi:uncharacterized protein DUF6526